MGIAPTNAQTVQVTVDTSLADYVLEFTCSGQAVDEDRLRNSRLLQAQVKHHSGNSERFTMDGFIDAAKAAARCEMLDPDLYRFRFVVGNKAEIAHAVDFLKEREAELAAFVVEKTAAYSPPGQRWSGEIVLAAASWSCGGFSMDGAFFIDVPCVAPSIEDEYQAIQVIAAHETYHALQYAFFAPFNEDMGPIDTPAEAQAHLFLNLLLEGTAEFVADSRDVPGEGTLSTFLRDMAGKSYRQLDANFRWFDYAVAVLAVEDQSNRRIRDIYNFGFMGNTQQKFYYVGATMARKIEAVFGRESLVCVMGLSPEQFVLTYVTATERAGDDGYSLGTSTLSAAHRLGEGNRSYTTCLRE